MDCGMEGITFIQVSLVKPQFASECDISNIISKFMRTGQLPTMTDRPVIQSTEGLPDNFQDLIDSMTRVRQQFDQLPLEERNKFNNNPEAWLEAVANGKQLEDPTQGKPSGVRSSEEVKTPEVVEEPSPETSGEVK